MAQSKIAPLGLKGCVTSVNTKFRDIRSKSKVVTRRKEEKKRKEEAKETAVSC